MAQVITRTVKTYKAQVVSVGRDEDGNLTVITGDSVTYESASPNDAVARAAFKAAGIPQKRGTQFEHELVKEVTYGITVEDFMAHAFVVEK